MRTTIISLVAAAVLVGTPALAQSSIPPGNGDRSNTREEGADKKETLGERLEESGGVIRPPQTGAPDMRVPPPQPNIDPGIRVPPPAVQKPEPK